MCQYFQSMMDNGVTSMHFDLVGVDSNYQMALQQLECMTATMETHHATPQPTKVSARSCFLVICIPESKLFKNFNFFKAELPVLQVSVISDTPLGSPLAKSCAVVQEHEFLVIYKRLTWLSFVVINISTNNANYSSFSHLHSNLYVCLTLLTLVIAVSA